MKINELFASKKVTFSCEIFPPKIGMDIHQIDHVIDEIAPIHPDFISVTCGAGGSTKGHTNQIAAQIQEKYGIPTLAHLTCVSSTQEEISGELQDLQQRGIHNILALRGDLPKDGQFPAGNHYHYASELITEIRKSGIDFCIGAACYPDGHVECASRETDIDYLKEKVACGCDFLTTQMFFDNNVLYNFLYRTLAKGIQVPIIAGVMPVTNYKQIDRSCKLSGTTLPTRFRRLAERFGDDPASMKQAGIAYATEQIIDLLANGVNHIHLYTMNKPEIARKIKENLSSILG